MNKMWKTALLSLLVATGAAAAADSSAMLPLYVGGRVAMHMADGKTGYSYAWPGVYFESQFTGDAVDVLVNDNQNDLYVYVDGAHKLTLTRPGHTTVALKDLGPGRHIVRLEKVTETQDSMGSFEGFRVASDKNVLPAPDYARKIEFIGDSYTVGYGNASRGQVCTTDDVKETTNTSRGFAVMTAKHFNAAYRIHAFSGRGVVRNYSNIFPGETLPFLYGYTLFDKSAPAPQDGWQPDVYVVGLGTNDLSTQLAAGEPWKSRADLDADYVRSYIAFVSKLHAKNPTAPFILMASTNFNGEFQNLVGQVMDGLKAQGITDVQLVTFGPNITWMGCHAHPSFADDVILSRQLIDRISALPKFASLTP